MSNAVEITNLYYRYNQSEGNVLNGVNLTVKQGGYICIAGHNGSGKSTLAKLINGLYKPAEGTVKVMEYYTDDPKNTFNVRKNAAMVFQNPDNQMIASLVEDDIAFGPENLGVEREEIGRRIEYALNAVGMTEYRSSSLTKLSGGQKQRVAIASVLAMKPQILILDEATAMLDPKGRKEVLDVVYKLNKEQGITVINITHFMEETLSADKIVVMHDGNIIKTGTPFEVFSDADAIEKAKLKLPKTMILSKLLIANGVKLAKEYLNWEELAKDLLNSEY